MVMGKSSGDYSNGWFVIEFSRVVFVCGESVGEGFLREKVRVRGSERE